MMALNDGGKERALHEAHAGGGGGRDGKAPKKKGAAKKAPKKAEAKPKKAAPEAVAKARTKVDSDDLDAAKAAKRIVSRWDAWQKATGELHDVNVEIRNRSKAAEECFKAEIEKGIEAGSTAQAASKLHSVVGAWQDWQEAIAQGTEERKEAKEKRSKAGKAFERAVEESRQLSLFGDD